VLKVDGWHLKMSSIITCSPPLPAVVQGFYVLYQNKINAATT